MIRLLFILSFLLLPAALIAQTTTVVLPPPVDPLLPGDPPPPPLPPSIKVTGWTVYTGDWTNPATFLTEVEEKTWGTTVECLDGHSSMVYGVYKGRAPFSIDNRVTFKIRPAGAPATVPYQEFAAAVTQADKGGGGMWVAFLPATVTHGGNTYNLITSNRLNDWNVSREQLITELDSVKNVWKWVAGQSGTVFLPR